MDQVIFKYPEPTECESLGRNGYMATHGVRVDDLDETNSVVLRPLHSRLKIGRASVSIHRSVLGELIAYLAEIHGKHMSAEDKKSFIDRITTAIAHSSVP